MTPEEINDNSTEDILSVFDMEFNEPEKKEPETAKETEPEAPAQETEPAKTEPEKGDSGAGDVEVDGSKEPSGQETPSEPAKSEAPEKPATTPNSDQLLADAMKAIAALSQKSSAQEKPSQPSEAEKAEEDADTKVFSPKKFDDYAFNITPKLYNGLFNSEATEEERVTCLQAYAAGIATTVHNRILKELGGWVKEQFSAVPGAVNYLIETREKSVAAQKSLRDDFYSAYPELNKPELVPLIKATIQSVQKETGAKAWDKNVRTLVGNRVKAVLSAYAQTGKPAPVAPKTVAPASSPAKPAGKLDPNSAEAIFDVFNSEF